MSIDDFIQNFEESIQGLEPGSVEPKTKIKDLSQWDSLAFLTTIAMIDAEYGVSLPAGALIEVSTLAELFEAVKQRCPLTA